MSGQKSVQALGALYFGRIHRQDEIASRGHKLYGQALIALNWDLQDGKTAWSISVIKSAMALELYEVCCFLHSSVRLLGANTCSLLPSGLTTAG